jgi:hypothetical protein
MQTRFSRRAATALLAGFAAATAWPALAHHGWSWTSSDWFELTGNLADVYVGNPHATLDLDVQGVIWRVELAPLSRTLDSGFNEDAVTPGIEVTAIGHRSLEASEPRMKAIRIIVGDAVYDVYADRAAGIPQ